MSTDSLNRFKLEQELQALQEILDADDPSKQDYRQRALYSYLQQVEEDSNFKRFLLLLARPENFNKVVGYEDIISAVWPGKEYAHPKEDVTKFSQFARKMLTIISNLLGVKYILVSIPKVGYQLIVSEEQ